MNLKECNYVSIIPVASLGHPDEPLEDRMTSHNSRPSSSYLGSFPTPATPAILYSIKENRRTKKWNKLTKKQKRKQKRSIQKKPEDTDIPV